MAIYPDASLRYGTGTQGFSYTENTFKYQFKYTPPAGFSGVDTFTYAVRDGKIVNGPITTDPQTESTDTVKWTQVTLNVGSSTNQNGWPVASPDTVTLSFGPFSTLGKEIDVLKNDTGEDLLIKLGSAWSLRGGRVSVVPNHLNNPVLLYQPGFAEGQDTVWYNVEDRFGRQSWSSVNITVTQ